jgi:glutathione S-transferase
MKLFVSLMSPYVRKVRMVIIEKGLSDQVELVECAPYDSPADLLAANPLGKVPALVRNDGSALFDSPVICQYLDGLSAQNPLVPDDGEARIQVLQALAFADGMTDAAYLSTMERRRPENEQSDAYWQAQRDKIVRGLDALEANPPASDALVDLGALAIAAALGYVDFRHDDLNWREGRPALAAWLARISERPSFQETVPPG